MMDISCNTMEANIIDHNKIHLPQFSQNSFNRKTSILERLERELQQTRNEFVEYKAEQSRKELENKLEQTEINKKNCRRSWLQVIIPLVLSPLITLLIEHFEDVIGYLRTFFHH